MMEGIKLAIAGATGELGRALVSALEERSFPLAQVFALASAESSDETLMFNNRPLLVEDLDSFDFATADIVVLCLPATVAARIAPRAQAAGCRVIDHSAAFRIADEVPLLVEGATVPDAPLVACASPEAALLVPVLREVADIRSLQVTVLAPVSAQGRAGVRELAGQTGELLNGRGITPAVYPAQVAFNTLPAVGRREEEDLADELERLLPAPFPVCLARVTVPVFYGLTLAVTVHTGANPDLARLRALLERSGVRFGNSEDDQGLVTPVTEASGQDGLYVTDLAPLPAPLVGLRFWLVGDNLRQGAVRHSLAILEKWIKDFKY
ncbi:MAG TPA: Asd/ArgC dimerization domain-containing protein [Moraxellaceae bacterium]|nr:Asd/ArgC dimerization domain-containing protein [Moraxellaceae bacterium]